MRGMVRICVHISGGTIINVYIDLHTFFFLCACVRAYVFIYTHLVSIPPTIPMGNEVSESASSSRLELHLK